MCKRASMLFIIIIFCVCLTACGNSVPMSKTTNTNESMFVEIEEGPYWTVVYHKETKVMYAVSHSGYNMGNFTVMVDKTGLPMIYKD